MSQQPTPDPSLASVVSEMRVERGLSRAALAFRSGITPGVLAGIETGQLAPRWDTVRLLANGLEIGIVELIAAVEASEARSRQDSTDARATRRLTLLRQPPASDVGAGQLGRDSHGEDTVA